MLLAWMHRQNDRFTRLVGLTPSQALSLVISFAASLNALLSVLAVQQVAVPPVVLAILAWTLALSRAVQHPKTLPPEDGQGNAPPGQTGTTL